MYETLILLGCDLGVWGWQLQGLRLDRTGYLWLLNFVVNHKPTYVVETSPQAKRHQPSLLITPITSLFQLL